MKGLDSPRPPRRKIDSLRYISIYIAGITFSKWGSRGCDVRDGIFSFRVELMDGGVRVLVVKVFARFDLIFFFFKSFLIFAKTKINNFGKNCKRKYGIK